MDRRSCCSEVIVRPVLCRPFVGRLEELAYLRQRRLEAAASHGGLVIIAGEAGVGKSRLIAEVCRTLHNSRWRIGRGTCSEIANRPYGPVLDAIAQLQGFPFVLSPAQTQREHFDVICERLVAIAERSALLVIVEDVHWADAATLKLVAYLGSKVQRKRILIVLSLRSEDLHDGHPARPALATIARVAVAGRIDLGPLEGLELKTFIDEALKGSRLPDAVRRSIALAGDGNPFFTEELLKTAVEAHSRGSPDAKFSLPRTVRDTLLERLRPFDDVERRIITQAAAIGRTFSLELLATTSRVAMEALLPVIRRARNFQLVEEVSPTLFRFRHGLTREAIYGSFLTAETQEWHRTIALAMESRDGEENTLASLAYHWFAAGATSKAAHYNEAAGDEAVRLHAHEDAIAFYQRVLALSQTDLGLRGSILEKVAHAHLALARSEEALASFHAAADTFERAARHDAEARCRVRAAVSAHVLALPEPTKPL